MASTEELGAGLEKNLPQIALKLDGIVIDDVASTKSLTLVSASHKRLRRRKAMSRNQEQ